MNYLKSRLLRLWQDESGWIGAALAGAGLLGKIFGGGSQKAAEGRVTQADLQSRQDLARTQQYGIGQNAEMQAGGLDLQRKNFSEDARGGRAKQALIADLLLNFKPTAIDVPGIKSANISGGLQLGEGGRAGAGELLKQALLAQLAGDKFSGGNILKAPGVQAIPKAGKMEKLGGILGTIGSIAGGIGQAFPQLGGTPSVPDIPYSAGVPAELPGGLSPEVLAKLRDLNVTPYGGQ